MEKMISHIGSGVIIENGSISTTEDFAVEGKVCTRLISTANVLLGQNAYFEGVIIAHNLEIKGSFKGTAYVKNDLMVRTGSKVDGTVKAFNLIVESGASFKAISAPIDVASFDKEATSNKVYSRISSNVKQLAGKEKE